MKISAQRILSIFVAIATSSFAMSSFAVNSLAAEQPDLNDFSCFIEGVNTGEETQVIGTSPLLVKTLVTDRNRGLSEINNLIATGFTFDSAKFVFHIRFRNLKLAGKFWNVPDFIQIQFKDSDVKIRSNVEPLISLDPRQSRVKRYVKVENSISFKDNSGQPQTYRYFCTVRHALTPMEMK